MKARSALIGSMYRETPRISVIVPFHGEGILAHYTLCGIKRLRDCAEQQRIGRIELVLMLDCADDETRRLVMNHPALTKHDKIIETKNADLGMTRNEGVRASCGEICVMHDGDDYFSKNWLTAAAEVIGAARHEAVFHPEMLISFDQINAVQYVPNFPIAPEFLAMNNPWTSGVAAKREVFERIPYQPTRPRETGFGFEDWHWNLELIADGVRHEVVLGTAFFYRRKESSMLTDHLKHAAVVRPSRFFTDPESWKPWV